eukprot:TRINITY_DN2002_c0_g1_i2.p1 TRINITY_DN2002_c0_g1~~TRINITY_DN2002_c0_g1_i2.p1  ORF type:complete len:425 (-),score=57.66 TRINITY_DN2002_c0_g1_i2:798-2072(-)
MPTKVQVKKAKGVNYFTSILDPYLTGTMEEIHSNDISDDIKTKVYKIYHNSTTYILKILICSKQSIEAADQARAEYNIARKLSQESPNIAAPLGKDEWVDPATDEVYIEMLFEYGGEPLTHCIKKLGTKDLMTIVRKTLTPLALMEKNGVFHSDIKPHNIVIKDGVIKVIDFGISKELNHKTMLLKAISTMGTKIKGGTINYLPPEIIRRSGHYILGKIDVYCWGMTIYQLITGKTTLEMANEVDMFKETGKDYAGFIKILEGIKVEGDVEGYQTKLFVNVLKEVLSFAPEQRPTFGALLDIFGQEYGKSMDDAAVMELKATKEELKKREEELKTFIMKNSTILCLETMCLDTLEEEYKKVGQELAQCKKKLGIVLYAELIDDVIKAYEDGKAARKAERGQNMIAMQQTHSTQRLANQKLSIKE